MLDSPFPATSNLSQADAVAVHVLAALDRGGRWTSLTLELLGDATALAKRWSGRVGAWVLTAPDAPPPDMDELARHGCDVLCRLGNVRFASWSCEVVAAALAQRVSPRCRV